MIVRSDAQGMSRSHTLVAIGNFDGVHYGHQAILANTALEAQSRNCVPVALTFEPHPTLSVGRLPPACLTPIGRKIELIKRVNQTIQVIVLPFDSSLAAQTPEAFARSILVDRLRAAGVRVGVNFRFGSKRSGNIETLEAFGKKLGFEVVAAPLLEDNHGRFSSTRARHAVAIGDLEEVTAILSRPHSLSGTVVEGQQLARTLGFPTANLHWVQEALPPNGVYCVAVDRLLDGEEANTEPAERLRLGVCNIGSRPTANAGFAVEVHMFDFDGNLYGARLRLHLIHALRSELKFASLGDLKTQIKADVQAARIKLDGLSPSPSAGRAWF